MSIQIVEIAQPSVIDTVAVAQPSTVAVVEIRQGPAGAGGGGSATWGGITGTLSAQTDLQTALNLKAPLASPALTGTPTAPTAATTTSTTQVATTAFVQQELASGVTVARNLEFLAYNGSGATIAKGSIVYINGAVGGVPRITKSQANNDTNSARTIGFVKADIADGENGFVIIEGELLNVRTADSDGIIGPGIQIYLSPTTPGAFTRTKPSAPQHAVYVGVVVTASTGVALDGKIIVGIQNGYELDDIHDVSIAAPVAGQVIKRNAGNTLWINQAVAASEVTGLGSLATQSGTFSGTSSGTNTGDQDLSGLLLSTIAVSNVFDPDSNPITFNLIEQAALSNGKRKWVTADLSGSLEWDTGVWTLGTNEGYEATISSPSDAPWRLTGWTVLTGSGQPTLTIDPPALLPVNASGTIALSTDMQGRVSPADMTGLGTGVATALGLAANAANGFPTANSAGRTALGSTATGDALFTAATPAAARTTLELGTANAVEFTRINVTGNSGVNGGLSWITSGALQGVTWRVHSGNIGVLFIARAGQGDMLSVNSGMSIGWSNNSDNAHVTGTHDLRLWRDGAGTLGQRNGTNAQSLRLYNTYTGSTSFERLNFRWSSNVAIIGTEKGSAGGTARDLVLETDGTERVRVLSTGNVGIGTTAPTALLDVNSNTLRLRTARTPASATAAGNAGDICWDADYIYVCTATNTWKRTAISTWP